MPWFHGSLVLEWEDPFADGIPKWGGTSTLGVDWFDSSRPIVYTSSKGATLDPDTIGICMNNAWYAASTEGGTYAVYADETDDHRIHLVERQLFSWPGDPMATDAWPVIYTGEHGSFDYSGHPLGYPCLAVKRSQENGLASFALAWRGKTHRELWAAHGTLAGGWEEVNVAAGLGRIERFCIAMDDSLNTWLVFTASDGGNQRIYISIRRSGGTWSDPRVLSSTDDYTEDGDTYEFNSVDFPTVAVSSDEDPSGPTVLVAWVVTYRDGRRKRVLGRSARVSDVLFAEWSIPIAFGEEVDVGGLGECWDPCVAATRDGTFVVAYTSPFKNPKIRVRYTEDPVRGTWSRPVEVCPIPTVEDLAVTQGVQNFASLSIDEASGRCFVCWEDTWGPVQKFVATSNGAVAALTDLDTWTPLGILTGHDVPAEPEGGREEDPEIVKQESTRYPCVVASAGRPQVFYRAVNDSMATELVLRRGRWT